MTNADIKLRKAIKMAKTKKGWSITINRFHPNGFKWYLFSKTGKYAHSFGTIWFTKDNEKSHQEVLNLAIIKRMTNEKTN